MNATLTPEDHVVDRSRAGAERLSDPDQGAVEALAAAMADWDAADLADYRASVLDELAKLRGRSPHGFLAVELAALSAVGAAGA